MSDKKPWYRSYLNYEIELKYRDFHIETKQFETEDQLSKWLADLNWASVEFAKVGRIKKWRVIDEPVIPA